MSVFLWIATLVIIDSRSFGIVLNENLDITNANQDEALIRSRRDIKGNNTLANRTYVITSILADPFMMLRPEDNQGPTLQGNERYEGYSADLAKLLSDIIGFTFRIQLVRDMKFGSKDENGNWNGMIGEIIRGEADMSIAPLTITAERETVVYFSKPFMSLGISMMMKKPSWVLPGAFSLMLNEFSYGVWLSVFLTYFSYLAVSLVLFLVSRLSPSDDANEAATKNSCYSSLWFSTRSCLQGVESKQRSISIRVLGGIWWFCVFILASIYIGLLSVNINAEREIPVESVEELAQQTRIKYGTVASGSTKEFFKKSTIPTYERMWSFMSSVEPSVFVANTADGVERVRRSRGRYAFFTESTTIDYVNQRLPCDTMKVGKNLDVKGYGVAMPIKSPLRDRITLAILELIEKGDLSKLEKKWWYDKGECMPDRSLTRGNKRLQGPSSLKLSQVAGIFYILGFGIVLSIVIAAVEFLCKSRQEAKRKNMSLSSAVTGGVRDAVCCFSRKHSNTEVADASLSNLS